MRTAMIIAIVASSKSRWEQRLELAENRTFGSDRDAEITGQHIADVIEVLDHVGPVVAEALDQFGVSFGTDAALAGKRQNRIARQQPHKGKGSQRDAEDGRHQQGNFVK